LLLLVFLFKIFAFRFGFKCGFGFRFGFSLRFFIRAFFALLTLNGFNFLGNFFDISINFFSFGLFSNLLDLFNKRGEFRKLFQDELSLSDEESVVVRIAPVEDIVIPSRVKVGNKVGNVNNSGVTLFLKLSDISVEVFFGGEFKGNINGGFSDKLRSFTGVRFKSNIVSFNLEVAFVNKSVIQKIAVVNNLSGRSKVH